LKGLLAIKGTALNGDTDHLLPNTCNVSFSGIESQVMIAQINKHLAVSSGSACTSASLEPSYVLKALGLSDELASSSIRFSLGRLTTPANVTDAIKVVNEACARLRV
jgi:cysteine desulfurase